MRVITVNGGNIAYEKYAPMVGAMNVFTTAGEVKARTHDYRVVWPDGSTNVLTEAAFEKLFGQIDAAEAEQDELQAKAEADGDTTFVRKVMAPFLVVGSAELVDPLPAPVTPPTPATTAPTTTETTPSTPATPVVDPGF